MEEHRSGSGRREKSERRIIKRRKSDVSITDNRRDGTERRCGEERRVCDDRRHD